MSGTLLPLTDDDEAWLFDAAMTGYPAADARSVARLAIDLATREPELRLAVADNLVHVVGAGVQVSLYGEYLTKRD